MNIHGVNNLSHHINRDFFPQIDVFSNTDLHRLFDAVTRNNGFAVIA